MTNIFEDDAIPRRDANEARGKTLGAVIERLMTLPGFAALRRRVLAEPDLMRESVWEAPRAQMEPSDSFEAYACIHLQAVTNDTTRDAYLTLLDDALFPIACDFLFGWPSVEPDSEEARILLAPVNQRLFYWRNEAFARTGADSTAQPSAVTVAIPKTEAVAGAIPKTESRRVAVDAFVAEVLQQTGRTITRRDIWRVTGYTNRTQFERFQQGSSKCGPSATASFTRILNWNPQEFVRILDMKRAME